MKKKLLFILAFTFACFTAFSLHASAAENVTLQVFSAKTNYINKPYAMSGTSYIPISEFAKTVGGKTTSKTTSNQVTQITFVRANTSLVFKKNSKLVTLTTKKASGITKTTTVTMSAAAIFKSTKVNNVTYQDLMIPARFLADTLGYSIYYNAKTKLIDIDFNFTPSSSYNWHLALASANISAQAYTATGKNNPANKKQELQEYGFKNVQLINIEKNGVEALVGTKKLANGKNVIAIAFRGTTIDFKKAKRDTVQDLITDLLAKQVQFGSNKKHKIALGFSNYTSVFKNKEKNMMLGGMALNKIIQQNKSGNRSDIFWISGHSLGGAVSQIYSADLINRGIKKSTLINYAIASPRFANEGFASYYSNKLNSHRIANSYDPVGHIVPRSLNYTSFGIKQLVYNKTEALALKNTILNRHYIATYQTQIRNGNINYQ